MPDLLLVIAAALGLPFVVFVCAKCAAYGWLRGKSKFQEDSKNNGERH